MNYFANNKTYRLMGLVDHHSDSAKTRKNKHGLRCNGERRMAMFGYWPHVNASILEVRTVDRSYLNLLVNVLILFISGLAAVNTEYFLYFPTFANFREIKNPILTFSLISPVRSNLIYLELNKVMIMYSVYCTPKMVHLQYFVWDAGPRLSQNHAIVSL